VSKTRRELMASVLGAMAFAPLASTLQGEDRTDPVLAGDALRVTFEGAKVPTTRDGVTLTFDYEVPGKGRYKATADFITSNMHGTYWDGTIVGIEPVVAKPLTFPDRPVMPNRAARFDMVWNGTDTARDLFARPQV